MKTIWKKTMPDPRASNRHGVLSWLLVLLLLALCAAPGWAATRRTMSGPVSVEAVARGLDTPWGLAFLPGGAFLVTERDGALFHFDIKGRRIKVSGVPKVYAWGQGGLMDVAAARDFPLTREIFLTFSKRYLRGGGTALAVAALSSDNLKAREPARYFRDGVSLPRRPAFRLAGRGGAGRDTLSDARRKGRPR